MARVWIGTSGWRYPPWRGVFYPERLPQRRELAHRTKDGIEVTLFWSTEGRVEDRIESGSPGYSSPLINALWLPQSTLRIIE